jgi:hypothetical protein
VPSDAGTGPIPPTTAKSIATGLIDVIGMTTDGYLVYFDDTGAVFAADPTGGKVMVAPSADAGADGYEGNVTGNYVWLLSNYTTVTKGETVTPVAGTLSVWSHALGAFTPIAQKSTGIVNIAADGSSIIFTDNSNAAGTVGNIGVVTISGSTVSAGTDIVTGVGIDSSSTTCPPLGSIDKTYIVTSTCPALDGGTTFSQAVINSYNTATSTNVVLLNGAIPTNETEGTPIAVDFATDTSGNNVLVVDKTGPTLAVQGIASAMGTEQTLLDPFTVPAMGSQFFYLSKASDFALYLTPSGHLVKSTFATPTSAPVLGTPSTDTVLAVAAISPDEKYDLDESTAIDQGTMYPTSMAIRDLSTGVATPLITAGSGDIGLFLTPFTDDVSYVIYTNGLAAVSTPSGAATVGTLTTAPVTTGVANVIEPATSKVWNATSIPGVPKGIIYNKNWAPITLDSNLPNNDSTADIWITTADATSAAAGKQLVVGADAPNYFYITPDGKNMYFTFSQVTTVDGALALYSTDGLYVMPIPAP